MLCYDRIGSVYNGYLTMCKYENFLSSATHLQWILCVSSRIFNKFCLCHQVLFCAFMQAL